MEKRSERIKIDKVQEGKVYDLIMNTTMLVVYMIK